MLRNYGTKSLLVLFLLFFVFIVPSSASVWVVASNTIQNSSNATVGQNTNTYILFKTITSPINISGTYRLKYEIGSNDAYTIVYSKVLKNGQPLWDELSNNTETGIVFTHMINISGQLNTTDNIELYGRTSSPTNNVFVQNFQLMYDEAKWVVGSNGIGGYYYDETFELGDGSGVSRWTNVTSNRSDGTLILSPEVYDYYHRYRLDGTPFDENISGQVHGTVYNSSWGNGLYGGAWLGNGYENANGSYINFGTSNTFNLTGKNFTFFARIKPTSCLNGANEIVSKHRWDGTSTGLSYLFDLDSSCKLRMLYSTTGADSPGPTASSAVSTSAWTNVTGVSNGTYVSVYYEDILKGTSAISSTPYKSDAPVGIGAIAKHPDLHYKGLIDDVRIWPQRNLSLTEIRQTINDTHLPAGSFIYNHTFPSSFRGRNVSVNYNNDNNGSQFDIYASSDGTSWTLLVLNATSGTQYLIGDLDKANKQYVKIIFNSSTNSSSNIKPLYNTTIYGEYYNGYSNFFSGYPTNLSLNSSFNVSVLSDNSGQLMLFRFKTTNANYYEIPYLLNNSNLNNITLHFSSSKIVGSPDWSNIQYITASSDTDALSGVNVTNLVINSAYASIPLNERFMGDYYPWYHTVNYSGFWTRWDNGGVGVPPMGVQNPPDSIATAYYPLGGIYDTNDSLIIDAHMKLINNSGLKVIALLQWYGDANSTNSLPKYFSAAENNSLKISIFIDGSPTPTQTIDWIINYINTYENSSAFYRDSEYGNRPVFEVYNSNTYTITDWYPELVRIRGTKYDSVVLQYWQDPDSPVENIGSDGKHKYWPAEFNETLFVSWANTNKKMYQSQVWPGYTDFRVRTPATNISRENGTKYTRFFNNLTGYDVNRIRIGTLNEEMEGSKVFPAEPVYTDSYGFNYLNGFTPHPPTYYLDKTAQMIWNYSGLGQRPLLDYYGNSKTNNYSIRFNLSASDNSAVTFNVTSNRTADIRWYIDDVLQQTNTSQSADTVAYFKPTFAVGGTHRVQTNASNVNGTTATLYWDVTLPDITSPASVTVPQTTTGNFWMNNTWIDPADADFDHVYFAWANGTSMNMNKSKGTQFMNMTYSPHYTQNISAQTVDTSGNMNLTKVWFNATIPNNVPIQATIGNKQVTAGNWLNITVSATDADNDTITYGTNATKGTLNTTTGNFNWSTTGADVGIYYWNFNSSDSYGGIDDETITVTVIAATYTPPEPVWISNTTGSYWANHSWQAGSGNATDSYNVSQNGSWYNGTATFFNASLEPSGWSNITIWAYNNSGMLSLLSISNNSQAPAAPNPMPEIISWSNNKTNDNSLSITAERLATHSFNATSNQTITEWSWTNASIQSGNGTTDTTATKQFTANTTISVYGTNPNGSTDTKTWTITVQDTIPPAQVTGLTNTSYEQTYVTLAWDVPASDGDLWGYELFRDGSHIAYTQTNSYNDTGRTAGTTYQFIVRANDTYGNWGANSSTLSTTTASIPPTPDTNTTPALSSVTNQTCGAHYCVISFDVNQSNAITRVRYGTTQAMTLSKTNQSSGTSRTDNLTSLSNNTLYYYTVDAWNSTNTSYYTNSTIQSFTTAEDYVPPEPPGNLPNITSWGNDFSNNDTLSLSVEMYQSIQFNATANQTLASCSWAGATQINCSGFDTYASKNFTTSGIKTVSVHGTNANGSTQTISWTVNVNNTYPVIIPEVYSDIYIKDANILYALNTTSGEISYKIILINDITTGIIVTNNNLFFGSRNILYKVNKTTGQILSKHYFSGNLNRTIDLYEQK